MARLAGDCYEVEVETVHPYDEHRGQLLEPDYWQF